MSRARAADLSKTLQKQPSQNSQKKEFPCPRRSPARTSATRRRSTRTGASGARTTRSERSITRSPEDIVAAARLVRKGKVISLALNFDHTGPQGAKSNYPSMGRTNPIHTMIRTGTDAYSGVLDKRGIRAADDMVTMPFQCGTQWDGLGHVFYENYMWNGYDCREVTLGRRAEVRHREDQEQDGRPRRVSRRGARARQATRSTTVTASPARISTTPRRSRE